MKTYLAYFYKQSSVPIGGWRDRLTLPCSENGNLLSQSDYDESTEWSYLGHWEIGEAPCDVWEKAWCGKPTKRQASAQWKQPERQEVDEGAAIQEYNSYRDNKEAYLNKEHPEWMEKQYGKMCQKCGFRHFPRPECPGCDNDLAPIP